MWTSIDLESMRFVHAHPENWVCSVLADVELAHRRTAVIPVDNAAIFERFTDLELRTLYENATGEKLLGYFRPGHITAVAAVAQSLTPRDVNPLELRCVGAAVQKAQPHERFQYVKGCTFPKKQTELWDPTPAAVANVAEAVAKIATVPYVAPTPAAPAQVATPAAKAPQAPRSAALPASVKGTGTVTERIYAKCDEVRAQMPSASLKDVRAVAVDALVAAGVNANSAKKGSAMWAQSQN